MNAEPLVFLVHRIPYPPNKGDKIRSFHLLRHLAARYRVHLGAFVDDPGDLAHAPKLREWCTDLHLEPLHPRRARLRSLAGLVSGAPLTLPYYRSRPLRRWLERTVHATGARRLVAFSAAMGQYADAMPQGARCVLDLVDVDSEKWRDYGSRHRGLAGWVYRREGERLLAAERDFARRFDATALVAPSERELFVARAPEAAARTHAIGNGVDTEYFRPDAGGANPYPAGTVPIVFTGAMDYWPNVDAVTWFAREVLPQVLAAHPNAQFHIAGARPSPDVRGLARLPGVTVVGGVPDMRPWLAHAHLVVAPLRLARGIQNKVLEGFAMDRPVLATSAALDGLDVGADYALRADRADAFARAVCTVLAEPDPRPAWCMRAWVRAHHDWSARLQAFDDLLEGAAVEGATANPAAVPLREATG